MATADLPYWRVVISGADSVIYDSDVPQSNSNHLRVFGASFKRNAKNAAKELSFQIWNPNGMYNASIARNTYVEFWAGFPTGSRQFIGNVTQYKNYKYWNKAQYMEVTAKDFILTLMNSFVNGAVAPGSGTSGTISPIAVHTINDVSEVVRWILDTDLANPLPGGVGTRIGSQFVDNVGNNLNSKMVWYYKPTFETLKGLSSIATAHTGSRFSLYVDANKQLHFHPAGSATTSGTLSDTTNVEGMVFDADTEMEVTKVYAYGGQITSGTTTSKIFAYFPTSLLPGMSANDQQKVLWRRNSQIASQASGATFNDQVSAAKTMTQEYAKTEFYKLARKNAWRLSLNQYVWMTEGNQITVNSAPFSLNNANKVISEIDEHFSKRDKYSATVVVTDADLFSRQY